MSHESDLTELWLKWVESELSQVSKFGFELSRSWVRLANLGFELSRIWVTWIVMSQSRVSPKKNESSTTLPDSHRGPVFLAGQGALRPALTCFFIGFYTDFMTSVKVLVASAGVLALASLRPTGPEHPRGGGGGGHTLSAFRHVARIWPRGGGFQGPKVNPTHNYTKSLRIWPTIFWERLNKKKWNEKWNLGILRAPSFKRLIN